MALQRSLSDYKPTAMKEAEARSGRCRQQPWLGQGAPLMRCDLSARPSRGAAELLPHAHRRRRSSASTRASR
jgi:hypothetical protein